MKDLLKNSLMILYRDCPEIVDTLNLVSFDKLNAKFKSELFARIDETSFNIIDSFMRSDEVKQYELAIAEASLAVTQDLSKLIELALLENSVKH